MSAPGSGVSRKPADAKAAAAELRTIRDLLRWSVSRFEAAGLAFGHGTDNAWDEAVALVLWSLHLPPDRLEPYLDARLCAQERQAIVESIEQRIETRRPAAYLTGEAWLRGLAFVCDERALVPRSPIAEALDESLPEWLEHRPPHAHDWPRTILDLCTGGGSLAIIAADRFPHANVTGTDLSDDALALAAVNRSRYAMQERIELVAGDLFEPIGSRRFDLILCNPPYVNDDSMRELPPEYRAEPAAALAGGVDGMRLVRRLVDEASRHLDPQGLLLLEIGHEAENFEAAFPSLEFHYLPVVAGERLLVLVEAGELARHARRS